MSQPQPLLEMRDITKSFFGVKVLDGVTLTARPGEVLALLGENGAGKSTLIKILNGDYTRDAGHIFIDGGLVEIRAPRDAEELGIRVIYQELHYAPDLSVAENLLLGHLPRRDSAWLGWMIDWPQTYRRAEELLDLLQVDVDPRTPLGELGVAQKQVVEIVKAMSSHARILVMDEPTAALTPREVDLLFDTIARLRAQGVAIIYISHRLDEIFRIAGRVTVLRDGKHVGTHAIDEVTRRDLVRMMVGHDVADIAASQSAVPYQIALEVKGLTRQGLFEGIDLQLQRGEITGMFGLLGAGHLEFSRALFGAEPADNPDIWVEGRLAKITSPQMARAAGIGFVPIDRKVEGLVMSMSVRGNITLANWPASTRMGFFNEGQERKRATSWIDKLGIRMSGGIEEEVRFLSGGNQQKVVLARWLEANTKILILDEPTWGVDVGARADIYELLQQLKAQGLAILIVSSDMQEVMTISDRILVMSQGRISGELSGDRVTQAQLLSAAAGGAE
jgi:ABC-type sugar transport system ATPase subunit